MEKRMVDEGNWLTFEMYEKGRGRGGKDFRGLSAMT